jgi:hypothetical protein
MATRRDTLCDDKVYTGLSGGDRLDLRPDLPVDQRAVLVDHLHQLRVGPGPEELHDSSALSRQSEASRVDVWHGLGCDQEVDAVRLVREGLDLVEQCGKGGHRFGTRAGGANHAQSAGVGDSGRERRGRSGTHAGLLDRDGAADQLSEAGR